MNRYWRKSRREEEKLRERREMGNSAQKTRTTIASALSLAEKARIPVGTERINAIVVNLQSQQAVFIFIQDPYAMNIDRERNYYNCGDFEHIARHCKNRRVIGQE